MAAIKSSAKQTTAVQMQPPRRRPVTSGVSSFRIAAWLIAIVVLVLVLTLHMLTALLAGLLVYQLVRSLTPLIERRLTSERSHLIAVVLLSTVIIGVLTGIILGLVAFFHGGPDRMLVIQSKLMDVIDQARTQMPTVLQRFLPDDIVGTRQMVTEFIESHSGELKLAGKEAVQVFIHVLVGMVLGAMVAMTAEHPLPVLQPLASELLERARLLADAFRRIVFAQIKISLLNTTLTAIFLLVILRLAGVHLPLTKTMIVVTFLAGLLPVIGNLISNSVIVVVALSVSLYVALAALVFLIVVHKLEYFLNARIVGSQINARSWELLLMMVLAEAAFGLPGLVAAPVYYAYIKSELYEMGWV
ncbi:AI-2E family transporter [Glaciimonas sp. CA11.2]|uniref:AI-2E family transporter n=1 Tax=unclassified Glaciimonas TaxID=2644401 RepID=UPI002AB47209|nr:MULTISPECIES: AI-2E family transporter [unclassified Glaciimonas]MDY7546406.1 AI-2E family transporter [Glaciimonas sp. CA11.2]MEB0014076.1 AI-2E family transporter [Glaciimonas sp. Cout2]MEB0083408.1 AI-2E family transporter [Glaciimonas sp. Gout2]MEB0163615.1 AI-2E family transporter [Glaciimonas sp. CA11.2]